MGERWIFGLELRVWEVDAGGRRGGFGMKKNVLDNVPDWQFRQKSGVL